ncbi:hypothetical protein FOHLNKBM_5516 [Methylobacterium longum]|nr:hypothetical protein FOHLNKBM_5516 [Methylobacterium longum]
MATNDRTPAGANGEGSGKSVCLAADTFQIAFRPLEIQTARVLSRVSVSDSVAAAIASLAYPQVDSWRASR